MVKVLVTGGAGYIGSHACQALANAGLEPIVYDSLETGRRSAVKWGPLEQGDIRDGARLRSILATHRPSAVMHFAAYIQVEESVAHPGKYYDNNVVGTLRVLEAMRETGVDTIVYSSTAAVYGMPKSVPVTEDEPLAPINPYGESKRVGELIMADFERAHGLKWAALRYFNAAGADPEGEVGPSHEPVTHLIPLVLRAALGTGKPLTVFGTDYETPDGTAIRDYIHVSDLANAHVAALNHLSRGGTTGAFNLGVGEGHSVREVIDEVARNLDTRIPFVEGPRRPGDAPVLVADARKGKNAFGWEPRHSTLASIITTAANWERRRKNP
jgi:UDP-arabinose 4-epimerase